MLIMVTSSCTAAINAAGGENESSVINDHFSNNVTESKYSIVPINPAFIEYQAILEQSKSEQTIDDNEQLNTISYDAIIPFADNEDLLPSNFLNIIQNPELTENALHPSGLRPSPVDLSYLSPVNMEELLAHKMYDDMPSSMSASILSDEVYPSRYDLREEGGVTAIRDQAFAGSCWAFGSLGSLESYLIHNKSENRDLSESHMKNTLLQSYPNGFDRLSHDDGGDSLMVLAYLARWDGPVTESDDPYDDYSSISPSDTIVAKHVQETLILPPFSQSGDLYKWAIMNYGAVTIAMHDDMSRFFNQENNTYYCYEENLPLSHAITLVGWDDDFDRNRFTPAAPGNGALIIKNSWGDNWGEEGYFYISYYDTAVGTLGSVGQGAYTTNFLFTAENVSNYDQIYQYDPMGWCSSLGNNSSTAMGANIFTATSNETLEAVGFYTTDSNSVYNISIYLDPEDGPINVSSPVSAKNGSMLFGGYHTVNLDNNVSLLAGQRFSVVVTLTTPGYNYPLAIEKVISGHSSNAHSESGQSYMSSEGSTWTDISASGMNACIKAFTKENKEPEAGFVAERRSVHVNEPVSFYDASLFSPESWQWDFGDNSTAVTQNPSHSYANPGIYNVSLNISNEFGSNVTTRTSFIQVLNTPITVNSSGTADFISIQDAIVAASEGDTIIVEPGTYSEIVRFRKDNITLRSSTGNPADVMIVSANPDYNDEMNFVVFMMADNITLQNVTVSGGYFGTFLLNSNMCTLNDCRIADASTTGLFVVTSENNSILNCTIYDNRAGGLYLSDAENNYLANNSIYGNNVNCVFISQKNTVDTSNTVDNKSVYYLVGSSDITIDRSSNAGLVHLIDCSNITIEGIEVKKNFYGIYLYNTTTSTIKNSTSSKNLYDIYLADSENNTIFNCTLKNSYNHGISLTGSVDNLIYNNYFNNSHNVLISGNLPNQWNIPLAPGTNIIGGSYLGGNYWAKPDGSGWSQVNPSTGDGFCEPYIVADAGCNIDSLPLTANAEVSSGADNNANAGTGSQNENGRVNIRRSNAVFYGNNIISVVSDMQFVGRSAEVKYEFTGEDNPVTQIRFKAQNNLGYVVADVSRLEGSHEGLSEKPSGIVYQNLDITLGDEQLSSSGFMEEAFIAFSVPRDWIESNDIDERTVRLEHYSNGRWEGLPTSKTIEADGKMYFEARTTGFSPFAICADIIEERVTMELSPAEDSNSKMLPENTERLSSESSGKSNNDNKRLLFVFMLILLVVSVTSVVVYRRNKK
ncbi:MAG: lectin like domain-containing protein [Methanolobus sp.]|nr:lectin like domain-containing protein [Methanolobus sp.]